MSDMVYRRVPVMYVAHPVSGDVEANLARARRWLRWLVDCYPGFAFCLPWMAYVQALDEATHRERGLRDDLEMLRRCDGIILVGGRLSSGMALEKGVAEDAALEVHDMLHLGEEPPGA